MKMIFRAAEIKDIQQIQIVRNAVKENILSNPDLVTDQDCEVFLSIRGKGWVCEIADEIVGFSIVDLKEDNVWALFVKPEYEKLGIGRRLHNLLLDWYFQQGKDIIWLGTDLNARAATFYEKSGWRLIGKHGADEIKFEMTAKEWKEISYNLKF